MTEPSDIVTQAQTLQQTIAAAQSQLTDLKTQLKATLNQLMASRNALLAEMKPVINAAIAAAQQPYQAQLDDLNNQITTLQAQYDSMV